MKKKSAKKPAVAATANDPNYDAYLKVKERDAKSIAAMEAMLDQEEQPFPEYKKKMTFSTDGNRLYSQEFVGGTGLAKPKPAVQVVGSGLPPMGGPPGVKAVFQETSGTQSGIKKVISQDYDPTIKKAVDGSSLSGGYYGGNTYTSARPLKSTSKYKSGSRYMTMEPVASYPDEDPTELMPELEESKAKLPADMEMFDTVRNSLKIYRTSERTLVNAIVVDKKKEDNIIATIKCYGGVAFGGYARDCSSDSYLVECVQAVKLGSIPFGLRLSLPKSDSWTVDIPIPEKVMLKAFSPAQRKMLDDLKEKFPKDRYEIHYLQMVFAN